MNSHLRCYVCQGPLPSNGTIVLNIGAMELEPSGARIPAQPSLMPMFTVQRHDHQDLGRYWSMDDIEDHQSANGQADVHFCSVDCLEALFASIVSAVRPA